MPTDPASPPDPQEKGKMVSVRLPPALLVRFDAMARERGVTRTALLAEAMEFLLDPRAARAAARPSAGWSPNPRQEALNKAKGK